MKTQKDDVTSSQVIISQKEFADLNKKLNTFVGAKVNDVVGEDYNMYYNKVPETYEPQPANNF